MTNVHKIWQNDAECVSQVCRPLKKFHFINPRWRTVDTLERHVLHHHEIPGYCNLLTFKMAAVRHLGIYKLKFLIVNHFRREMFTLSL